MAGTDQRRTAERHPHAPAVVLVGPQLGENVGAVARAMKNCALSDLRLVAPRDGWPNPAAARTASGADDVLEGARVFATFPEATADLARLYATTARPRDMVKPVLTPRETAAEVRRLADEGARSGLVFGPERIGLTNDEVALADAVVTVPLDPAFASLNLGQAVLLLAYEWYQTGADTPGRTLELVGETLASREKVFGFFDHLERALDATGFFKVDTLRPTMVRTLHNLFHRAELTEQEVRTLHGVVTSLCGRRLDQLDPSRAKPPRKGHGGGSEPSADA